MGLKSDGRVVAVGLDNDWQCRVDEWTGIVQTVAGTYHTVGLKSNGRVVAAGYEGGQCNVGDWTGIKQVAAGDSHTVGLKSDGTVAAVGRNDYGQCDVGGWRDIVQVAAGGYHTVGLKSDGTAVAVGKNHEGQCNVGGWTGIVGLSAGYAHTVGLRSDGTAVASGDNYSRQIDVIGCGWMDIMHMAAGVFHTVGLKSDGKVVATGLSGALAQWNLELALPPSQYLLTVSSTAGGSVGPPGEGRFCYYPGTKIRLVAEPEDGYRFVRWAGDSTTIANANAATTTITVDRACSVRADFRPSFVGIEEGDWIWYRFDWPLDQHRIFSLRLEFLSIDGATAAVETMARCFDYMGNGRDTILIDKMSLDIGKGSGEAYALSAYVVRANLTKSDTVHIEGYGDVTLEGETTRTWAGARRRAVYASFMKEDVSLTYYWDKKTGVMVEASITYAGGIGSVKVRDTDMFKTAPVHKQWWFWLVMAAVAVALGLRAYRKSVRARLNTARQEPSLPGRIER